MSGRKGVANEGLHVLDALVDLRSELQFKVQKERQFINRECMEDPRNSSQ